jgi:arylsulfatase A-like enzyme
MSQSRSLILITVDCLRADHTGFLGYERPTTPFLDEFSRDCLLFRNAIVAGAPTYYSFPAIMASRYPLALGRDVVGLAPDEPTIATTLSESGYATAAFMAANPYLSPRFGYSAGFDTFHDSVDAKIEAWMAGAPLGQEAGTYNRLNRRLAELSHKLGPIGSLYDKLYFQYCQQVAKRSPASFDALRRFPAADVLVDRACEWLAGVAAKPFFLWLHFMDPHSPYYPPEEALRLMGQHCPDASRARYLNSYWNRGDLGAQRLQRHRDEIVALYDAGIRWVDAQVRRLVDLVRQAGLWDKCVIALTADHGEEFLDHGGRYHPPSKVAEELIRVPLLLRIPGLTAAEVRAPFSLLDLAPTLLAVMDIQEPATFRGRNRWNQLRNGQIWDEPAITECVADCTNPFRRDSRLGSRVLCVREERYKLVLDFVSKNDALYDLADDPKESLALGPQEQKPVRRRLLDRARRHLKTSVQSRDREARLAARLRDLALEFGASAAHTANRQGVENQKVSL